MASFVRSVRVSFPVGLSRWFRARAEAFFEQVVADMPLALDDERNYGRFLHNAARITNFHPALIKGIMKQDGLDLPGDVYHPLLMPAVIAHVQSRAAALTPESVARIIDENKNLSGGYGDRAAFIQYGSTLGPRRD